MILRLEQYLARVAEGTGVIPENPETNTETYLAILAGENRQAPEPVTRLDMYLYNLIGGNYPIPAPNTRIEQYLAKACGLEIEVPTPITREEQLWYAIANPSWPLTTLTGTLPLTFQSKGTPLTDYKLYGTSDGAGVETESGEPTGYKLPMTVESGEESTTTPIYIGDSKLGEEEYVDYGEQKVYKRTENLVPEIRINNGWRPGYLNSANGAYVANNAYGEWLSPFIELKSITAVSILYKPVDNKPSLSIYFFDANDEYISSRSTTVDGKVTFDSFPSAAAKIRYAYRTWHKTEQEIIQNEVWTCLVEGSTPPETYIPYLQPTDPPVPLPPIHTYKEENTLSSTETLGEVTVKGRIKDAVSNG